MKNPNIVSISLEVGKGVGFETLLTPQKFIKIKVSFEKEPLLHMTR